MAGTDGDGPPVHRGRRFAFPPLVFGAERGLSANVLQAVAQGFPAGRGRLSRSRRRCQRRRRCTSLWRMDHGSDRVGAPGKAGCRDILSGRSYRSCRFAELGLLQGLDGLSGAAVRDTGGCACAGAGFSGRRRRCCRRIAQWKMRPQIRLVEKTSGPFLRPGCADAHGLLGPNIQYVHTAFAPGFAKSPAHYTLGAR